jgi:putative copper export protein
VENTRLFLHVLAATVWVGGQLVLAALVPAVRRVSPEAPRAAARAYNRIAWPAFAVLVVTGIWNVVAVGGHATAYRRTLSVKLVLVVISGGAAFLHTRSTTAKARAATGAAAALAAVGALLLGIVLAK